MFHWLFWTFFLVSPKSTINIEYHSKTFISGHKVHGQSFYWIELLCHYEKILIFQYKIYFKEDHVLFTERMKAQWWRIYLNTFLKWSCQNLKEWLSWRVWWRNLVQFRRWWEWAEDRILIWTFKNKVYTSQAVLDSGWDVPSLGKFYWELLNCLRIIFGENCLGLISDKSHVFFKNLRKIMFCFPPPSPHIEWRHINSKKWNV